MNPINCNNNGGVILTNLCPGENSDYKCCVRKNNNSNDSSILSIIFIIIAILMVVMIITAIFFYRYQSHNNMKKPQKSDQNPMEPDIEIYPNIPNSLQPPYPNPMLLEEEPENIGNINSNLFNSYQHSQIKMAFSKQDKNLKDFNIFNRNNDFIVQENVLTINKLEKELIELINKKEYINDKTI